MYHQEIKDYLQERVKKVIVDRKLNAKDLVKYTGVTYQNAYRITEDNNYALTMLVMLTLAVKLGCTVTITTDLDEDTIAEYKFSPGGDVSYTLAQARIKYSKLIKDVLDRAELTPHTASKELDVSYGTVTRILAVPQQVKLESYIDQLELLGYETNVLFQRDDSHILNSKLGIRDQNQILKSLRDAYTVASKGNNEELLRLSELGVQGEARALVSALRVLLL